MANIRTPLDLMPQQEGIPNSLIVPQSQGDNMPRRTEVDFVQIVSDELGARKILKVSGFRVITRAQLSMLFQEGWKLAQIIPHPEATLMVFERTPLIVSPYDPIC